MSRTNRAAPPHRLLGIVITALLTLTGLLTPAAVAAPSGAISSGAISAAPTERITAVSGAAAIKHGAGIRTANGTWFGQWLNNGRLGYCIDPLLNVATMPWYSQTAPPKLTKAQTNRLSYIVTNWGNTKSNAQAASVRLAALLIVDPKSSAVKRGLDTKSGLPTTVIARARTMVLDSANLAGPYRVQLSVTKPAVPGATGTLSVVVRSAVGKPVAAPVTLGATQARLARAQVTTTASGAVNVPFTRGNTPSSVSFSGRATMASPALMITRPPAGFQRLISFSAKTQVVGTATYQAQLNAPTVSYSCTIQCDGVPPVTLRACNTSSVPVTYGFLDNGRTVSRFSVAAGQCASRTVAVPDAHVVTATWQVGSGPATAFNTRLVVDCPPLPAVLANVSTTCDVATVTASLPRNATHAQRLFIDGQLRQELQPGQAPSPITKKVPCGSNTMVSFATAVRRMNGQWNKADSLAVVIR